MSVFELLADSREQVRAVAGYVQAARDFWIAETNLQTALTGRSPSRAAASTVTVATERQDAGH